MSLSFLLCGGGQWGQRKDRPFRDTVGIKELILAALAQGSVQLHLLLLCLSPVRKAEQSSP